MRKEIEQWEDAPLSASQCHKGAFGLPVAWVLTKQPPRS
jgi:hypothetical protein